MMLWIAEFWRDSPIWTSTWVDWLDIAVLTWAIHRVLLLIRGTKAMQSLMGLGLLAIAYVLSDLLGMTTIHYVLDNLSLYVVLTLLILFQDDIRRALARAGGSLFSPNSVYADANLVDEVVQAAFELARRKIGALVVFERAASLEPYVDGAHPVHAHVTTELLQSMFHPSSPLHDGAVVISEGRIMAAGVFLPITLSKEVSRSYGTRHRAALGITEETDAVALVVSEERGTVSIVDGGVVTPVADADDLRARLQEKLDDARKQAVRRQSTTGTMHG